MRNSIMTVVSLGLGFLLTSACGPAGSRSDLPPAQRAVTIGTGAELLSGLIFLADEQGLFAAQGLTAKVRDYPSGKLAYEALQRGEIPVAACASLPIVFGGLAQQDLRVLAVIGTTANEMRIVARRDRGITQPGDLRGKRIATQATSSLHFFLHLFLLRHNVAEEAVVVSFVAPEQLAHAVTSGAVDAAAVREPFTSAAVAALGSNAVVFSAPGFYEKYYLLVTRREFLERQPATLTAILRGLVAAAESAKQAPAIAQVAVARRIGGSAAEVQADWRWTDFRVTLPQAVVLVLENEARWAVRTGGTSVGLVPDYLALIDRSPLEQVQPEAVTIIH